MRLQEASLSSSLKSNIESKAIEEEEENDGEEDEMNFLES